MKKSILIIIFLLFSSALFSQKDSNAMYKSAVNLIKQSEGFKSYCIKSKQKNNNLKVIKEVYSVCEYVHFFKNITGIEPFKSCIESDYINETFKDIPHADQLSDKGEKSYNVWFSNVLNTYFVAKINRLDHFDNSIAFLFQIENEKVELIKCVEIPQY